MKVTYPSVNFNVKQSFLSILKKKDKSNIKHF